MTAVSDTSPINDLVLIGLQDVLSKLLDRVLIPEAVHRELQSVRRAGSRQGSLADPPDWLEVRPAPNIVPVRRHLYVGERDAISLALSVGADLVLLDERKGRQAVREQGL